MAETQKFWELVKNGEFEVFVSQVATDEIDNCNDVKKNILYNYLGEAEYLFVNKTADMEALAAQIIATGILSEKSFDDCCHIALAILNDCDVIVSWNFKHLVNPKTIRGVRAITISQGYKEILICDPLMMLGGFEYDS
jgi:predicted nucleic acid-binding protein